MFRLLSPDIRQSLVSQEVVTEQSPPFAFYTLQTRFAVGVCGACLCIQER